MIETTAAGCLFVLALALLLCLVRAAIGPSTADRVVALDAAAITIFALLVVLGIREGTTLYLDAALVIAVLGFFGTVAMAKYLMGGTLADRPSRE